MIHNMDESSINSSRGKQCNTENDIGKLRDGGVGKSFFKVIFRQCQNRCSNNSESNKVGSGYAKVQGMHCINAKDVKHCPGGAENTNFNNSHCVEKCRDWSRRNHGTGQPVMEGHDTIFGKSEEAEDVEHNNDPALSVSGKESFRNIMREIQSTGNDINKDKSRQQEELGSSCQVNNIFLCSSIPFFILCVGNKRIGTDRNNLVKQIHGE